MFEDIRNFLRLSENLYTGGMPKDDQLADAAEQGVNVVINLALHDLPNVLPNEEKLVESLGMKYINVPVLWNNPTRENLDAFMDAMDSHKDKSILVHCEANYRATGFVTLYRILRLGWDRESAFKDMHKVWNEEKYPVWKTFIEDAIEESRNDA
jgi:protein tyrosine phosphatase (PTP) superfamily phosphohydrolase (DUF442 family)